MKLYFSEDCELSEWTDWSWSNKEQACGIGEKTRSIVKYAKHGGKSCDRKRKESVEIECPGKL